MKHPSFSLVLCSLVPLLSSERGSIGQLGLTTGWLGKHSGTRVASDSSLCVGEDGGDVETAGTLDIHEVGSWGLDECLEFVALSLSGSRWVQQINNQNLIEC